MDHHHQRANPNLDLINETNTLNKSNANANAHHSDSFSPFLGSSYIFNPQEPSAHASSKANSSSSSSDVYSEADDDIVGEDDDDESDNDDYVDSDEEQRRLNYNKRAAKMASTIKQSGAVTPDQNLPVQPAVVKRGRRPKIPGEPPRPRGPPRGPRGPYKPRKPKDPSSFGPQVVPSRSTTYIPPSIYQPPPHFTPEYPYRHPALNGLPPQAILVPMPGPNGVPVMVPYLPASMIVSQGPSLAGPRPQIMTEGAHSLPSVATTEPIPRGASVIPFSQGQMAQNQMLPIPIITTPSGMMVSTATGQIIPTPSQFRPDNTSLSPTSLTFAHTSPTGPQPPTSIIQQPAPQQLSVSLTPKPIASQRLIDAGFDIAAGPSLVKDRTRRSNLKSVDYSFFDRTNENVDEDEDSETNESKSNATAQNLAPKKKARHEEIDVDDKLDRDHLPILNATEAKDDETDDEMDEENGDHLPFVEKILALSVNGKILSIDEAISYNDAHALITPGTEHEVDGMRLLSVNRELPAVLKKQSTAVEESSIATKRVSSKSNKLEGPQLFLVKVTNRSYWHTEWVTKDLILAERGGNVRYHRFLSKPTNLTLMPPYFDESYLIIDRILDLYIEKEDAELDQKDKEKGTDTGDEGHETSNTTKSISSMTSIPIPSLVVGRRSFLIKWKNLSYDAATWEYEDAIRAKDLGRAELLISNFMLALNPTERKIQTSKILVDAKNLGIPIPRPPYSPLADVECETIWRGSRRQLRPYQREGVDWLSFCWCQRQPCIIADEMGLGKTIQATAFLARISGDSFGQVPGPFLVVSPLSCIPHWERELAGWAPSLSVLTYQGRAGDREALFEYEFWYKDEEKNQLNLPGVAKFDVLLVSYEMAVLGQAHLRMVPFRIGIFDEAHRLKNRVSRIAEILNTFRIEHKILLTGTPLQNSIEELFALLSFIQPWRFTDEVAFLAEYGKMERQEDVAKIQALLRPLMLRRMKEDVEASIPLREETIIEVALSPVQKRYYRAILERNLTYLAGGGGGAAGLSSLANAMMELRKVCMHPFLIEGAEEALTRGADYHYVLTHVSSKLLLVDKLLRKLREDTTPHRVLIFSQMTRMLDLMETLLEAHSYPWERIDGRVRGDLRQAAIDRFCDKGRDAFVFLLCTRAGGVGINLTAADTVIIFDSDWNPQNDIQAMARCHRIGQTRQVKVYRLICTGTYEQEMLERAGRKLGLDKAILQKMMPGKDISPMGTESNMNETIVSGDGSGAGNMATSGGLSSLSRKEIEHLLRKGAYGAIFSDEEEDLGVIGKNPQDEEDIDVILERRTRVITHTDAGASAEIAPEQGSSIFSKASFVPSKSNFGVDVDDPNFWTLWARHVREGDAANANRGPGGRRRTADDIVSPLEEDQRRFKRQLKRITKEGGPFLGNNDSISLLHALNENPSSDASLTESGNSKGKTDSDDQEASSDVEKIFKALLKFGFGRSRLISDAIDGRYTAAFIRKITKSLLDDHILKMSPDAKDKTLMTDSVSLLLLIDDEDLDGGDQGDSTMDAAVTTECQAILEIVGGASQLFERLLVHGIVMRLLGRIIDQLFLAVPRKGKKTPPNLHGSMWLDFDPGAALTFLGVSTSLSSLRSKAAPSSKALATFAAALASYDWPTGSEMTSTNDALPEWWQVPLHDAALLLTVWINGLDTPFANLFSDRRLFPNGIETNLHEQNIEQRFRALITHVGEGIETQILEKVGKKDDASTGQFSQFDIMSGGDQFDIALPPSRPRKTPSNFRAMVHDDEEEEEEEEELWEDNRPAKNEHDERRNLSKRTSKRRGQVVNGDEEVEAKTAVDAEATVSIRRGTAASRHGATRRISKSASSNDVQTSTKDQKKNTSRPTSPRIKLRMTSTAK